MARSVTGYRGILGAMILLQSVASLQAQQSEEQKEAVRSSAEVLESLREAIVTTIAPNTWTQAGGEASVVAVERWNLLIVCQTEKNHEAIHELLNAIQRVVTARKGTPDDSGVPVHEAQNRQDLMELEKIRVELARETKIDFLDEPLSDAMNYLEQLHGIQIEIDQRAVEEGGLTTDTPIAKQLSGISLRSALDLLLRDLRLTHAPHNGVLLITTPEVLDTWRTTKVYDLSKVVSK